MNFVLSFFHYLVVVRCVGIQHYLKCINWVIVLLELIVGEYRLVVAYNFTLDVDVRGFSSAIIAVSICSWLGFAFRQDLSLIVGPSLR
jgi:hypothetical protein